VTEEQLDELKIDRKWLQPLLEAFQRFDINTSARQAAFIGQCAHESGNFKTLEENLNYSAESLCRVWPGRFPHVDMAQEYARNPSKIANKVYAARIGNGDEASGDGWRYHGRGLIQLTGKDNYRRAGEALGVDLLSDPNKAAEPEYACLTAGWYWKTHGLNELADQREYEAMTVKINGGLIGLDDRIARIDHAMQVIT
jgi:putative chitinase